MTSLIPFEFEGRSLRVVMKDATPWWVASDVCDALDIVNARHAVSRLEDYEKDGVVLNDTIGRPQTRVAVNESGIYSLVMGSRKKEAKAFKKWVICEVLPSIRATGSYSTHASVEDYNAARAKSLYTEARALCLEAGMNKLQATAAGLKEAEEQTGIEFPGSSTVKAMADDEKAKGVSKRYPLAGSRDGVAFHHPADKPSIISRKEYFVSSLGKSVKTLRMDEAGQKLGIDATASHSNRIEIGRILAASGFVRKRPRSATGRAIIYAR